MRFLRLGCQRRANGRKRLTANRHMLVEFGRLVAQFELDGDRYAQSDGQDSLEYATTERTSRQSLPVNCLRFKAPSVQTV